MLTAIVFLCAISIAPQDCDLARNSGMIITGGEFTNEMWCLHSVQQEAAKYAYRITPGYYPKAVCMRWRPANQG